MADFPNEIDRFGNVQIESGSMNEAAVADVDMAVLLDFEGVQGEGEPDLIVELIDLYLADFPQQLAAMKESVSRADEASLKRAAHTLKGSSGNLGVEAIAALCQEIEQTDSSASFECVNLLISRLEQSFARVDQIFKAERDRRI